MFATKSSASIHLYLSELIPSEWVAGWTEHQNEQRILSNLLHDIPVFPKVGAGINFDGRVVAQRDIHFENLNFVISNNMPKTHNSSAFVSAHACSILV